MAVLIRPFSKSSTDLPYNSLDPLGVFDTWPHFPPVLELLTSVFPIHISVPVTRQIAGAQGRWMNSLLKP